MIELDKLYGHIYNALKKIHQSDLSEKAACRALAMKKKQQITEDIHKIDTLINEISPYQLTAAAYVSPAITQKSYSPCKTSLSNLQSLYGLAITSSLNTVSNWERLYETASAGIAYYKNIKKSLLSQEEPIASALSSCRCDEECRRILKSDETQQLILALRTVDNKYTPRVLVNKQFIAPQNDTSPLFGRAAKPFPITDGCMALAKQLFGGYFSENDQSILLPCSLSNVTLFQIYPNTAEQIMSAIRAYIPVFLCYTKPVQQKVYYIDTCTMDSSCLGILLPLLNQNSSIIMPVPSTPEETRKLLAVFRQSTVSSYSHGQRLLVYRFHQSSHDPQCNAQMQWLCANASNYKMQIVIIQEVAKDNHDLNNQIPDWFPANANIIRFGAHKCLESIQSHYRIATYSEPVELSTMFVNSIIKAYKPSPMETRYFNIQPLPTLPTYSRDRMKPISLLYGIGENGEKQYLDLVGSDFSAYILGSSRSGKSNLLNVLITSAIINYHPDDLELWLVDFGRTEFKRYVDHTPPHVRYVLVEKTTELISSLVDRLIAEMDFRGDILSRYNALKMQELPEDVHLPSLLIIIDEFGVFKEILSSDTFDEKKKYKTYMERLLKQGAKHGMYFIFSNQSYSDIYSALPEEGSDQIGLRLAMYTNNKEEMKAVLKTKTSNLSEEEKTRIEKLPLYQVLFKSSRQVGRLSQPIHVLDMTQEEDKTAQTLFIDSLNTLLQPTAKSRRDKSNTYHAHQQLCLKYDAIPTFRSRFTEIKEDYDEWTQNIAYQSSDLLLYLGEPRNMEPIHHELLRNNPAENLILYGEYAHSLEKIARVAAGVVNSASFQNWPIEFWCDEKDVLAKISFDKWKMGPIIKDRQKIVSRVKELNKQIRPNSITKKLIVVSGLSSIVQGIRDEIEEEKHYGGENGEKKEMDEKGFQEIRDLMAKGNVPEPLDDDSQENMEDITSYLSSLIRFAPKHNVHFMIIVQKEDELKDCNLTIDHFSHYAAFSNGLSDTAFFQFKRRVDRISTDNMFGCLTGNGLFTVYTPFSM